MLGVDMVVLFAATAIGIGPLVLVSGGLASVVLGPAWWVSLARVLSSAPGRTTTRRPAKAAPAGATPA